MAILSAVRKIGLLRLRRLFFAADFYDFSLYLLSEKIITNSMLTVQPPFSNMQMELLKLYAAGVPGSLLPEIKELIARFLLSRAKEEAGKIWIEKGYNEKTVEAWS